MSEPLQQATWPNGPYSRSSEAGRLPRMPNEPEPTTPQGPYPGGMPVPAATVAAEIRNRLPDVGEGKLHKLLYYAQGHHLATVGELLFAEPVSAWETGPAVAPLHRAEQAAPLPPGPSGRTPMTNAQLGSVGYTISRYGNLTTHDLGILTRAEPPWQRATAGREPGDAAVIDPDWMRDYFRGDGAPELVEGMAFDPEVLHEWLKGVTAGSRPSRDR